MPLFTYSFEPLTPSAAPSTSFPDTMYTSTINSITVFLAAVLDRMHWISLGASNVIALCRSSFFFVVGLVHTACGTLLGRPQITWKTVFAFRKKTPDVGVVIRVTNSCGFGYGSNHRIQGCFILQQSACGLTRLLINGEAILPPDGETKQVWGALYFPDESSIRWEVQTKKVKSGNESAIRGRSILISFFRADGSTHPKDNVSGVLGVQITFVHTNSTGKQVGMDFEEVINDIASNNH